MKYTALLFSILSKYVLSTVPGSHFEVAIQWNYLNFTWSSTEQTLSSGYVPGEDIITGIKIYKNVIYLALPRIKRSSRVTLASIPIDAIKENPLLSPYPSWEMNLGANCATLQNVQSMEIDADGIMWVLDGRRSDSNTNCLPRIVLLDINDGGKIVQDFLVPDDLCSRENNCFLNDIVVDGDYAYISDTTSSDPGILIYHRLTNSAWEARDSRTMVGASGSNINGIALSPACQDERTFYYMPMGSLHIFSVSNTILKNQSLSTTGNFFDYVTDQGTKQTQSGGMICDTDNNIYYGLLSLDGVGKWNTREALATASIVETNHEIIKWPDSFSLFGGYLYLITNNIQGFTQNGIDKDHVNFRIIRLYTNTESYIFC